MQAGMMDMEDSSCSDILLLCCKHLLIRHCERSEAVSKPQGDCFDAYGVSQ